MGIVDMPQTSGLALLVFGGIKGHFAGINRLKSAMQTLLVVGLAAGAAYALRRLFGDDDNLPDASGVTHAARR